MLRKLIAAMPLILTLAFSSGCDRAGTADPGCPPGCQTQLDTLKTTNQGLTAALGGITRMEYGMLEIPTAGGAPGMCVKVNEAPYSAGWSLAPANAGECRIQGVGGGSAVIIVTPVQTNIAEAPKFPKVFVMSDGVINLRDAWMAYPVRLSFLILKK